MSNSMWHPVCRECLTRMRGRDPIRSRKEGWRWEVCCFCGRMSADGYTAQGAPRQHVTHQQELVH